MVRSVIYKWLGIILVLFGIFCIFAAINGIINPGEEGDVEFGYLMMGMCTATTIIPGIVFFVWGWNIEKRDKELKSIAGYLVTYRRIKLENVARKLGKTEYEAEKLIAKCVSKGYIRGHIDRTTNEFFTQESLSEEAKIERSVCPNCGGPISDRVLVGETIICRYCGANLSHLSKGRFSIIQSQPPPPPPPAPVQQAYPQRTYRQAPSPPGQMNRCPYCGWEVKLLAEKGRWYCGNCKRFL